MLAALAALAVRRWAVTLLAVAALGSGFAALGGYLPFGLYEWLWHVPGMSLQRAPARFTLITVLSLSVLAAFGSEWLARSARMAGGRARRLLVAHIGVVLLLALLVGHLVVW